MLDTNVNYSMCDSTVKYKELRIIGIAPFYPTCYRPELGVFVKNLFMEMRRLGINVKIIAPLPITQRWIDPLVRKKIQKDLVLSEHDLYRPLYSNIPLHFKQDTKWAHKKVLLSFQRALHDTFKEIMGRPDFVYAHFFASGLAFLDICEAYKLPCFVGLGESGMQDVELSVGEDVFVNNLKRFSGVIAVSKENEDYCRMRCPSLEERLVYIPNGVDTTRFYPRDRSAVRRQLGLPQNSYIAVFCGHFIERKGPKRVLDALKRLHNVYGVFIGQGNQVPLGSHVLHAGPVLPENVSLWLSAGDVFVLPSIAEGMSNATLEAIASGLPVVVSDRPFNRGFLNQDCAVFVDPLSPSSIANGIWHVLECPSRRSAMSKAAFSLARQYSLSSRAKKIVDFCLSLR